MKNSHALILRLYVDYGSRSRFFSVRGRHEKLLSQSMKQQSRPTNLSNEGMKRDRKNLCHPFCVPQNGKSDTYLASPAVLRHFIFAAARLPPF